jgi:membrane fusion protein YbhG
MRATRRGSVQSAMAAALAGLVILATMGCAREDRPDAYGNVEAVDVIVGAEATGQLIAFSPQEGQKLAADVVVGSIDSTELDLERTQLTAQRAATASRVTEIDQQEGVLRSQQLASTAQRDAARAQRAALEAQFDIARRNFERTKRLADQEAATAQQLDQAERDYRVLEQQMRAQQDQIAAQEHQIAAQANQIEANRAQRKTALDQVASAQAQIARVAERVRKSDVRNPVAGTVLATYVKAGEVVQPGQPLYKIADLGTVEVRAYVDERQLAAVHLGSAAQVTMDAGSGRRSLPGTVSWVSSQAEFTPTPIQTREERADLVYAVKIRVANTGDLLKIGMPVDVRFGGAGPSR